MWDLVQQSLREALASRLYPTLFSDRYYRDFLSNAGLNTATAQDLARLNAAERETLTQQAKITAHIITSQLRDSGGLTERNVRFELLKGPLRLYRAGNSAIHESKIGIWWFSEEIWDQCRTEAGSRDEKQIEWLHANLAVCYDWSQCDQLYKLELGSADEVLAIRAGGAAMPVYGSPMRKSRLPGLKTEARILGGLPGGVLQTVLPYIPEPKVSGHLRLAGRLVRAPFGN